MQGDEQGMRVVPEHVLTAVAVVHIRIHNGNAQGSPVGVGIVIANILHHHGFIVDIAEAAVAVDHAHGVVAWRTHQGKGPVLFFFQYQTRGGNGPAGRGQMGIRTHRAHRGQAEMGARQLGMAGKGRPVFADAGNVEKPFLLQLVAGVEQAFLALWMRG